MITVIAVATLAILYGAHLHNSVAYANHDGINANNDVLTVTYIQLDGSGDSTLIQLPNQKVILIDGGYKEDYEKSIKPVLDQHNIDTIDLVIVTHKDQDHANGINGLLEGGAITVSSIWFSPELANNTVTTPLYEYIEQNNIPLKFPTTGEQIHLDTDVHVEILAPNQIRQFSNDNENSIVTLLEYGDIEFLFTGDIQKRAEQWLIENTPSDKLDIDIMNAPHHGSAVTSNTVNFITATSPELVIYSADEDNHHGHPNDDTRDRYTSSNVNQLQTGIDGHINIQTDGTKCSIVFVNGTEQACFDGVLSLSDTSDGSGDDIQAPDSDDDSNLTPVGDLTVTYIAQQRVGDSVLITTPDDRVVLIDSPDSSGGTHSETRNALNAQGIRTIDLMIATNDLQYNIEGLNQILKNNAFTVSEIWFSQPIKNSTNSVRDFYTYGGDRIVHPTAGHVMQFGNMTLEVLSPQGVTFPTSRHDNSLVTLLEYADIEILFTGDIKQDAEAWLVSNADSDKLNVDIINAPYHGHRDSSTAGFISATSPELVIYNTHSGANFPHQETVDKYTARGITQLDTSVNGDIKINTDGTKCSILFENGTELACLDGVLKISDVTVVVGDGGDDTTTPPIPPTADNGDDTRQPPVIDNGQTPQPTTLMDDDQQSPNTGGSEHQSPSTDNGNGQTTPPQEPPTNTKPAMICR